MSKNKLLKNFFSLSSIQLVSYILPLLTIPYLVRVLGVEKFGLIALAQATIQYFVIFTDYGFGLSATKEIAQEEDKNNINRIFSSVMFIKIFFLFISFLVLYLLVNNLTIFEKEKILFYCTFGIVIGQVLFPVWYFQGIEKMHITALINILPKLFFTISIFIFISTPDDYILVAIINSLGFIISGILSMIIAIKKYKVKFEFVNILYLRKQLIEGYYIFIGILSSSFSILNVTFILGILTNPTIVGYYAAVEKIIRPLSSLNRPVINAIFPHLSKTFKETPKKAHELSKKVAMYASIVMFSFGLILILFSDYIVLIIFGKEFDNSSIILKIMAFIPMIQSVVHIYGIPNMIILEYKKVYSNILFVSFLLSLILSYIFILNFNFIGAALTSITIELFVLITILYYLRKLKDF